MWFLKQGIRGSALLTVWFLVGCYSYPDEKALIRDLQIVGVYPIESAEPIEPSGLCILNGELYSVSDDTPDWIFKVVVTGEVARFEPYLQFTLPDQTPMDLEGIEIGPDGLFYLLNETSAQVLRVDADGQAHWVTANAIKAGKAAGLFQVEGGRAEGLAILEDGRFLVLAERQPRGWLEINDTSVLKAASMPKTRFREHTSIFRIPDFTGAARDGTDIWVLHRNLELIGKLEWKGGKYVENEIGWSFRHILKLPDWAYLADRFGTAEGLAMDASYFYVVLDNNGSGRKRDTKDKRPLLLVLKRP